MGLTPGAGPRRLFGIDRRVTALLAVAAVAVVLGAVVLGRGPAASPSTSPGPAAVADLVALTHDGHVNAPALQHDSRDDLYRTPGGAVPAGTAVTLRLRASAGDLTSAAVLVRDTKAGTSSVLPMAVVATDGTGGKFGYDYWEASLATPATPTVLEYQFAARDGDAVRYLSDDAALDGGTGNFYEAAQDQGGWQISVYDPAFTTPAWTRGAVVYQIFPDRFRDGDPSNDPSPTATQGTSGAARFRYGDVYGNPVLPKAWTDLPEGYCRAYQGAACAEQPLGRDFFGGDLAGITSELDQLQALGVTAIYLNPIFAAPSNHRYDTSDYFTIDPDLGTQADFDALVAAMQQRGMHLILDGVFNHVSSDSPWFDRAHRFADVGACESPASAFRSWFTFRAPSASEPSPCAPSTAGGSDTYYVGWAGFDTIPEVREVPAFLDLITGKQGVVPHWLGLGASGWRLDVMDNLSDSFLEKIRAAAKAADPNALVLGEQWNDASAWLLGNEADSVMNYRFRRAVIGLVNGPTNDLDGSIDGLSPSQFVNQMLAVREDYPPAAFDALLNLVDSHDTTRILWTLTPGADNQAAKSDPAALAIGKAKLREVAALQLTWPGMASIYYGDEVGLTGQDDPDDRRPYPWTSQDTALRTFYDTLGTLRGQHEALRTGDLRFLLADDDNGAIAFVRRTDQEAVLTVINTSATARDVGVPVADVLPDGLVMADALGGGGATVVAGDLTVHLPAYGTAVLVTPAGTDLAPPATPSGLQATAGSGSVALRWAPVDGAARYRVFRSLVAGGGDVAVADATGAAFTDLTARNGTRYHYRVAALDAAGNLSAMSDEAVARPQLVGADATLQAGPVQGPISATAPTSESVLVRAPGTEAAGAAVGVRVQIGFGPSGDDPASSTAWTWTDMRYDSDVGGADRYVGEIRPEKPGSWIVAARLSTTGGEQWTLVDQDGAANGFQANQAEAFSALPPSDTSAPPAPALPTLGDVSGTSVTIRWAPVQAPDVYRYQVWRSDAPGGPYTLVGTTAGLAFVDVGVQGGAGYAYVVTAQDTSYNVSPNSPELVVTAAKRTVNVTFTVTLPAGTPPGDTIFIAGDFQGWNPGATAMTKVDATHWTITLPFEDGQHPQYKYTRGTWDAVEKDTGCGEIPNRTITVSYGDAGSQSVSDVVGKWRDTNHCG